MAPDCFPWWPAGLHIHGTPFLSPNTVPRILAELEILGITGAGSPSSSGPGTAGRGSYAVSTPATLPPSHATLPAPIEHFLIQGDLTAIAPGFLAPAVAAN